MEIRSVVFSENIADFPAPEGGSPVTAILNPTYIFRLKFIPSVFTFHVLIMFQGLKKGMLKLDFALKHTESEKVVAKTRAEVNFEAIRSNLPIADDKHGYNVHFGFTNIPIEQEGEYSFDIYRNGKLFRSEKVDFIRAD